MGAGWRWVKVCGNGDISNSVNNKIKKKTLENIPVAMLKENKIHLLHIFLTAISWINLVLPRTAREDN